MTVFDGIKDKNIDECVPKSKVMDMINYCYDQKNWYRSLGSTDKVECYTDFIYLLKSIVFNEDEEVDE